MKVQKVESAPEPTYPSHRQFAECKALIGAAVIGLSSMAMAADEPPVIKGKIRVAPAAAPAKPVAPVANPEPKPQAAGGIRAEPAPAPKPGTPVAEPKPQPAGGIRAEPPPAPKPAK